MGFYLQYLAFYNNHKLYKNKYTINSIQSNLKVYIMLKIRFHITSFSISCLFIMHAYCSDINDMMTPVKNSGSFTIIEFTLGQVMSQR